jgi:ABC-type amino acid transport substrate-binding protein
MSDHTFTGWRRSSRSGSADSNCVEVALAHDDSVGVRDSKDQAGPVLEFSPQQWSAFIAAVQAGEFDHQVLRP